MRIEDVVIKTLLSVELSIATACKMFMPFRGNCFGECLLPHACLSMCVCQCRYPKDACIHSCVYTQQLPKHHLDMPKKKNVIAVSYTHLTLPTMAVV